MNEKNTILSDEEYSQHLITALAKLLMPKIKEYYESEEGKEQFEEWKSRHQANDGLEEVGSV